MCSCHHWLRRGSRGGPRGRNDHFAICYDEMLTPEVRSTLVCTLEPGHEDAHAAEIGISDEGLCDQDMWLSWQAGVPRARQIHQPGTCNWTVGEMGVNPCLLFERHPGMHLGQGIGLVNDEGLNRHGERPTTTRTAGGGTERGRGLLRARVAQRIAMTTVPALHGLREVLESGAGNAEGAVDAEASATTARCGVEGLVAAEACAFRAGPVKAGNSGVRAAASHAERFLCLHGPGVHQVRGAVAPAPIQGVAER